MTSGPLSLSSPYSGVGLAALPSAQGTGRGEAGGVRRSTVVSALAASRGLSALQSPWPAGEAPGGEPRQAPARPLQGPAAGSSSSRPTPPAGAAAALHPGSSSPGCQAPGCLLRPGTPQGREGGMSKGGKRGKGCRMGHRLPKGQRRKGQELKWSNLEGRWGRPQGREKGLGGEGLGLLRSEIWLERV